jgi:hypothetical protein
MTLLIAYAFDEPSGNTVIDYSGNNNNFSIAGSNALRDINGHTFFGLTKNGVTMPQLPLIGQTANRTIMLWVKGTGTTWVVRQNVSSIGSGSWGIMHLSGNIAVQARSNTDLATRPTYPIPGDGLWHHYAATYDGTAVKLYVDGVFRSETVFAGPLRTDADSFDIMEWTNNGTVIDDLRIYDEALTESQIAELMDTPVASSGSGVLIWSGDGWVQSGPVRVWSGAEWS